MTTDHKAQVEAARDECKRRTDEFAKAVLENRGEVRTSFREYDEHHARMAAREAIDRLAALASAPPASEPATWPKWFVDAKARVAASQRNLRVGSDMHLLEMAVHNYEKLALKSPATSEPKYRSQLITAMCMRWSGADKIEAGDAVEFVLAFRPVSPDGTQPPAASSDAPHPCEEAARADLLDELEDMRIELRDGGQETTAALFGKAIAWIAGERDDAAIKGEQHDR